MMKNIIIISGFSPKNSVSVRLFCYCSRCLYNVHTHSALGNHETIEKWWEKYVKKQKDYLGGFF